MDQINWLSSISKVSSLIAEINDLLRNRVSVASDDDSNQNLAEAVWEEEHRWRQNRKQVDADCCNAVLATSREYALRLAYQQTENANNGQDYYPKGSWISHVLWSHRWIGWIVSRFDLLQLIEKLEAPTTVKADELEDSDRSW